MSISDIFLISPQKAYEVLEHVRWGSHPICPYCESPKVWKHHDDDRDSPRWQCGTCEKSFCVTVKTLFHGTHTPLKIWFLAAAYMHSHPNMTISRFAREVGLQRRATASRIWAKLRSAIRADGDDAAIIHEILVFFDIQPEFEYEY